MKIDPLGFFFLIFKKFRCGCSIIYLVLLKGYVHYSLLFISSGYSNWDGGNDLGSMIMHANVWVYILLKTSFSKNDTYVDISRSKKASRFYGTRRSRPFLIFRIRLEDWHNWNKIKENGGRETTDLSWDGKCVLLRVSRSMHGSERSRPGMGHLLMKKNKVTLFGGT